MFTRAIVRPPAPNFSQGLTTAGLGAPNYERALEQHEAYCAALEQCGLTAIRMQADERYPDACFVEDAAVMTRALPNGRANDPHGAPIAILTRPGARSRRGELASIRKVLADLFPALQVLQPPGTLDGGDVCQAGSHFFIGVSERTNKSGAQQLAELLAPFGYTTGFVDIRVSHGGPDADEFASPLSTTSARLPRRGLRLHAVLTKGASLSPMLHLKSGLAYLDENRLVVIEALADHEEFSDYDLVRVNSVEEYAANCVKVNEHVLVAAGHPALAEKLRGLGYQTIELDMSEFQKMDGGLSCLSLRF